MRNQEIRAAEESPSTDSEELNFLEPGKLRVFKDPGGKIRLTIEGDRSYLQVKITRLFPLSDPNRYIRFSDSNDEEIGLLRDLRQLERESAQLVREELTRRYFTAKIREIKSLRHEFGISYWHVVTDRGERQFVMRGLRENVYELRERRILLLDVDGNRFEIPDYSRLDIRSLTLMQKIL